jgi:hypothetical protein
MTIRKCRFCDQEFSGHSSVEKDSYGFCSHSCQIAHSKMNIYDFPTEAQIKAIGKKARKRQNICKDIAGWSFLGMIVAGFLQLIGVGVLLGFLSLLFLLISEYC